MKSSTLKSSFRSGSLHDTRSPRSVLLRMAADQERADRIRALKQQRPDLTWRRIADHVGVSERAAADWQRKGGIEYDNAKKLAEIFEVDLDFIWRGPSDDERAPSPFAGADSVQEQLEALNAKLDRVIQGHAALLDLFQSSFEHWSAQGDNIFHRLDAMEQALKTETDALLPGVRELLDLASPRDPAREPDSSAGKAS